MANAISAGESREASEKTAAVPLIGISATPSLAVK
jgi:hypothetical protein